MGERGVNVKGRKSEKQIGEGDGQTKVGRKTDEEIEVLCLQRGRGKGRKETKEILEARVLNVFSEVGDYRKVGPFPFLGFIVFLILKSKCGFFNFIES